MGSRASGFGLLALAGVACGSTHAPALPAGPPASLQATAEGTSDVIVAHVNGRPVWGSCVAAQAAREHATRGVAVRECIDFELMAQAAEQRGLATDPEVVDATRTALVNQLVAHVYEDGFQKPEDFGDFWQRAMVKGKLFYRFKHVEYRASAYVRVPVAAKPPAEDPQAKAVADKIAAAVANERGMLAPQFFDIAAKAAAGAKTEHAEVQLYKEGALDDNYGAALWAIPEIGRASPVVRTSWGYDVILWTDVEPAADPSPDELAREALPEVKQAYFPIWAQRIGRDLGVHVTVAPDAEHLLESLP